MNGKISINLFAASFARLGTKLSRSALYLVQKEEKNAKLIKLFLTLFDNARDAPNELNVNNFFELSTRLEEQGKKLLTKDEDLQTFLSEINKFNKIIVQRAFSKDVPMPRWAKFKAILPESTSVLLKRESVIFQDAFLERLSILMKSETSQAEKKALTAYRRMTRFIGHDSENGFSRVFDYCAKHAENIASATNEMQLIEDQLKNSDNYMPAIGELLKQTNLAGGYFYPIRGELAEIYLHHWPNWRITMTSLEEIANSYAVKLGKGWKVQPFSGGALIDGKKAWDEGILLIKPPSGNDRMPRAVLVSAAQVKVEDYVTALEQTIKDRMREIGTSMGFPRLSLIEGNFTRDFILETLPEGIEPVRFVFNALEGKITPYQIAKLRAVNLQVTQMPLDISIDEFGELARQVMYAVRDLVK